MGDFSPGMKAGYYQQVNLNTWLHEISRPVVRLAALAALEMTVTITDISFYQDDDTTLAGIDFAKMKTNGAQGVVIRGGQNTWVDEDFVYNWREAKLAGLPRGIYWFWDSRSTPESQALRLFNLIKNDMPEMHVWMDYEETYGGAYGGWRNFKQFIQTFNGLLTANGLSARVGIYTGYYYWAAHSPNPLTQAADLAWFGQYELWLAWYTTNPANVRIPAPWDKIFMWQWTSNGDGRAYGVESLSIDLSWFNGSEAEFDDYAGVPPPGGSMYKYSVTPVSTLEYVNVRKGHSTGTADIGDLTAGISALGNELWGDGVNELWLHVLEVDGRPLDGWVAVRHLGKPYTILAEIIPPESEIITLSSIEVDVDGVIYKNSAPVDLVKRP